MANVRMERLRHVRCPRASQVVAWCCFLIIAIGRPGLIAVAGDPEMDRRASALIDQLVARERTLASDRSYVVLSGRSQHPTDFLPLADRTTVKAGDLVPKDDAVLALIRLGTDAIPALVAHLDDKRPTEIGPFSVRCFQKSLDWNTKSRSDIPLWEETSFVAPEPQSPARDGYHLTVGDLCYEVLGQIVNRDYDCVIWLSMNYDIDISSPGQSSLMRDHLKKTWGTLSRERHRQSLVSDFQLADSPRRRQGAYCRLAFYYPEAVERVVLDELQKPPYRKEKGDGDVSPHPLSTRAEQADFIRQLTRDQSRLIGDRVNEILETATDDDGELIPACLHCLANRGYGDVLIRCLEHVDPRGVVSNYFDVAVVAACATSHDPPVRERLRRFALATDNGTFFVKALDAFDSGDGPAAIAHGRLLLGALRKDEVDREGVLSAIVARYPNESLPLTAEYLKDGAINRIWNVCEDLARPTDRRFLLLEPYLDDRGEYVKGRTVAGMVAYSMAKTIPDLEDAVDGLEEPGPEVIEKLKQHCRSLRTTSLDEAAIDVPVADE